MASCVCAVVHQPVSDLTNVIAGTRAKSHALVQVGTVSKVRVDSCRKALIEPFHFFVLFHAGRKFSVDLVQALEERRAELYNSGQVVPSIRTSTFC